MIITFKLTAFQIYNVLIFFLLFKSLKKKNKIIVIIYITIQQTLKFKIEKKKKKA